MIKKIVSLFILVLMVTSVAVSQPGNSLINTRWRTGHLLAGIPGAPAGSTLHHMIEFTSATSFRYQEQADTQAGVLGTITIPTAEFTGTYSVSGNNVTLTFGGDFEVTGRLSGNTLVFDDGRRITDLPISGAAVFHRQ